MLLILDDEGGKVESKAVEEDDSGVRLLREETGMGCDNDGIVVSIVDEREPGRSEDEGDEGEVGIVEGIGVVCVSIKISTTSWIACAPIPMPVKNTIPATHMVPTSSILP